MRLIRRRKGEIVSHGGVDMRIVATPEFDTLTLQGPDGEYLNVSLADLQAEHSGKVKVCEVVDVVRQEKIPAYLKAFESLLDRTALKAADVEAAGSKVGIGRASAYAALARYRLSGSTADLPPPTRSGGRGKSRLSPDAEKTIKTCIEEVALTRRNFSRRKFLKEAALRLEKAGFKVSRTTLRNRLDAIPDHKWNKARRGYNESRSAPSRRRVARSAPGSRSSRRGSPYGATPGRTVAGPRHRRRPARSASSGGRRRSPG